MLSTKNNNINDVFFCSFFRLLCQDINKDDSFRLEYRGPVVMKGKPTPMNVWFLMRNESDTDNVIPEVNQPDMPQPSPA